MRWQLALAAVRCTSLLSCALASGYSQQVHPPPDATARIKKIFTQFNRSSSPGCVAGAAIAGVPVVTVAYGMADLEYGVPLTPRPAYYCGRSIEVEPKLRRCETRWPPVHPGAAGAGQAHQWANVPLRSRAFCGHMERLCQEDANSVMLCER